MTTLAAVDLGGTQLRTGWWKDGGWHDTESAPTRTDGGEQGLVSQIVEAVRSGPPVSALVVATAGMLDPSSGRVVRAANLPLRETPLRSVLQEELGIPVAVIGDAVAATVAEFSVGAARGLSHGAYVTASTGIGLGMVIHGSLVRGNLHQAGELGHIPVTLDSEAPACQCGQRGCLELFSSGSGIAARYAERNLAAPRQAAREILALAEAGEPTAAEIVGQGAQLLGAALAVVVRLLSPEVIVIGGGLARSSFYLQKVVAGLDAILADSLPGVSRIIRRSVTEPSNALVGAALAAEYGAVVQQMLRDTGFDLQLKELR